MTEVGPPRPNCPVTLPCSSPCLPPPRVASLPQFRYCAVSAAALPESRELAARGVDGRQDPGGCCTVVLRDRADWGSARRVCAAGGRRRCGRSSEGFGSDILVKEAASSLLVIMEPKHSAEMSKHLDKQNHALMETYRAMSHELHKLQVEEETIMRKLYELMSVEGLLPKPKKERQLEKAGESTQENEEREP